MKIGELIKDRYGNSLRRAVSLADFPIRRKGKKTRLWVDNEYYKNGYAALFPHGVTLVYGVLAMHANAQKQTCFPAVETIMKLCGIKNKRTAIDALRILEGHDIIAAIHTKGRTSNTYVLLDCSVWKAPNSGILATVAGMRKKKTVAKSEPNSGTFHYPSVASLPPEIIEVK